MTTAFISYAHNEEAQRDRLHKHLATLRRDELLQEWSDHEIMAGDRFKAVISDALEKSALFIALLSPDYLASNYCYDVEFARAQQLERSGRLRIVGIVVEPCDWKNSPFKELVVLPKDGKAVSDWTNPNTAYLNVAQELRRILSQPISAPAKAAAPTQANSKPAARRLKVKQDFDVIQRAEFADAAYETMRAYFDAACAELPDASEHVRSKFEGMSKTAFTCTIVNRAQTRGGDAHITVRRNKSGRMSAGEISFVFTAHADDGTSNGWLSVEADDYHMFLRGTLGRFGIESDRDWTPEEAAEGLWNAFMQQAGLEFEA